MPNENKQEAPGDVIIKVFGIKNCDSCRKALKWLETEGISHRFHDVREHPPSADLIKLWCESAHGHKLLNRRSTTWRSLNGRQRAAALNNPAPALSEHPTLIKRPVFMRGREVLAVGFRAQDQQELLLRRGA